MSIEKNLDNVKINSYDTHMDQKNYHHGNLQEALIDSGLMILKEEGIGKLTLRSAARKAGVSHSAPYAHFTDKSALLAAISTRGFMQLFAELEETTAKHHRSVKKLLLEFSWSYAQFALGEPALFKLMFSGILQDEHSYPDYMAAVRKTYQKLVEVVALCQSADLLQPRPPEETAIAIWSLVHGFVFLYMERQFPGQLVNDQKLKSMLARILDQFFISTSAKAEE